MPRKSSISEEKRAAIIREVREGGSVAAVAKNHGISAPTLYLWVRGSKKGGKKKRAKKAARQKRTAGAAPPDLSSMMEEISIARKFKEFLAELGYSKR